MAVKCEAQSQITFDEDVNVDKVIVVDDGSSDNTKSLIEGFINESKLD